MWNKTKSRSAGKIILQTLFFFLLVTQICFAQWYLQNSGTTVKLNSIHFEDVNNGWVVGDSGLILHTTNGGQEWIPQTSGMNNHLNEVWFADLNTGWAVGNSGTILNTSNGGLEWIEQSSGTNLQLNSVSFTDADNGGVVGDDGNGYGIILHTNDGGMAWVKQSNDTLQPSLNSVCFVDSSTGWAAGNLVIFKTIDGGNSWVLLNTWYGWDNVYTIFFFDLNNGWIAVYGVPARCGGVLHTINGGIDWEWDSGIGSGFVNSIYFNDANNGWAVGWLGGWCLNNIYKSIDGGTNWISQPNVTTDTLNSVYFTDLNNGWIVGENGTILHTTNGGGIVPVELTVFTAAALDQKVILSWTTATELNNNGFEIQRRVVESEFATIGFVKGEGTTTNQKEYSYKDKDLVDGKYFYRLKQVDYNGSYEYSDVIEVDVRSLNEYALEQNYPNPFNPTTTIGYVLKEKTTAKLILLNAIGEQVAILVNEEQEKGFHKIDYNASTLSSGVYFYRLQAGDIVQTRKMILLK
jgi:photosystem II stability/assembly factor-like uncharacterized protein